MGSDSTTSSYLQFIFQIFADDIPEVEQLPREDVLEYLEKTAPDLVIPYLVSYPHTIGDLKLRKIRERATS